MEDPILPIDIKNSLQNAENCDPKDPCDIGLFDCFDMIVRVLF